MLVIMMPKNRHSEVAGETKKIIIKQNHQVAVVSGNCQKIEVLAQKNLQVNMVLIRLTTTLQ